MGISYNTSTVRDGLVLHLDAANRKSYPGTGTAWNDLSGNGNNGTLVNGPTFDNTSISFDGVNDSASFPSSPDITGNSPWTISIWANINSLENGTGRQGWIIWKGSSNQTANQLISMGVSGGSLEIAHWGNDTVFTNSPITFNGWAMYTCTFDGTNELVYVNGVQTGSKTTTLSIIAGSWYLASRTSVADYLNMKTSSFQAYNRALSSTEVFQKFNALRGRYGI